MAKIQYAVDWEKSKDDFGRIEIEDDGYFGAELLAAMKAIDLEREGFGSGISRVNILRLLIQTFINKVKVTK